ncbi:MAG: DUF4255 domain-containing protein [Cyanobacteria bacterium P01_C01_bin.147]
MSNPLAIAAVTATLRNLLIRGFSDDGFGDNVSVTTRPLDQARDDNNPQNNQVNLFLYQTQINAAWRNCDLPGQVTPGETGFAPLPLNLHYLLTAYGPDEDVDLIAHQLLGRAMSILHDNPILGRDQIEAALTDGDLHQQIERVRITPDSLSLEDLSKLWTTFQTQYRTSTSYEVAVVLIESKRPTRSPLPVLQRGRADQGVDTTTSASPVLREIRTEVPKPAVELGDRITIVGDYLTSGETLTVQLRHPLLTAPLTLAPLPERQATELQVELPNPANVPAIASAWLAGFLTLSLLVESPDLPSWTTNEIPIRMAPQITVTAPTAASPGAIPTAPQGTVSITLTCIPQVRVDQRVMLLFGDRQIPPETLTPPVNPTAPSTLTFVVEDALPGTYVLRLRVDGVDSLPIDFATRPPQFTNNQKVTINE